MAEDQFHSLADVIADELFPEVDLALREGHHIDDLDLDQFTFLEDARPWLGDFYARYHCDLVRSQDGYFFLNPRGDRLGKRMLSPAEMLVGQTLCLLRLDPATLRTAGRIERIRVLEALDQLLGAERLGKALNPRRKRRSQAVEEEEIRKAVEGAIRTLARLGFVEVDKDFLRLRVSLSRFAEPVEPQEHPAEALAALIRSGPVKRPDSAETS